MKESTKGYLAAIVSSLIIGFSFLFVKVALVHGNPLDILTHRFSIALLIMLPFAIVKRKKLSLKKTDISAVLLMALLYPILAFGFQIWGLNHISSAEAGIIQAIQPVLTMVTAIIILKEKISGKQKLFTFLSVFGVLFIFLMQGINSGGAVLGYIIFILSNVALALYVVLVRRYKEKFSVFQLTFFCITLGTLFFNALSISQHIILSKTENFFEPLLSIEYLVSTLYLGILASLVTLALANYSYSKIEASKLGVFGNLVPVVAIFSGVIILKDSLSWVQIVGAAIILIGIIGVNNRKK